MSAMPIARRTVAAVLLASGCAVAPPPAPAATCSISADPYSSLATPSYTDRTPPSRSQYSTPPPARHSYNLQHGQYKPYYCYSYPANCVQSPSYPFYSYPPSYYLSPNYDYAWPYGGGVGFGAAVGPAFGFGPGIVVNRGFVIRRGIRIRRGVHIHRGTRR